MFTPDWFKHKTITVMGLGLHGGGLGVAKWLVKHGAKITVTDLKDQHALAASIDELERFFLRLSARVSKNEIHRPRYVLGRHEENDFTESEMIIWGPGVPREHPLLALAKKHSVPIATDATLFFTLCPFPITAVTGTKGKTTTTMLLGHMAKRHDSRALVAGNLRISMLDELDTLLRLAKKKDIVPPPIILELSSWQLEGLATISRSPHIGVITNVMEDHLNRYRDMDDYALAKSYNVAFQHAGDIAVLNARDQRVVHMTAGTQDIFWFGKKKGSRWCAVEKGNIVVQNDGKITTVCPVANIKLVGEHNVTNILAATSAATALGVPVKHVRATITSFQGAPGRLEIVGVKKGIQFVNDTTATAPDATIAALKSFPRHDANKKIILIAGGTDKALHFEGWAKAVANEVKDLVLFDGTATEKMEAALSALRAKTLMIGVRSMHEAVQEALRQAAPGDIILLSPGCASFGLFQHEFDRGEQFEKAVKKVK